MDKSNKVYVGLDVHKETIAIARSARAWLNDALTKMDAKFSAIYEVDVKAGRPSIAPES